MNFEESERETPRNLQNRITLRRGPRQQRGKDINIQSRTLELFFVPGMRFLLLLLRTAPFPLLGARAPFQLLGARAPFPLLGAQQLHAGQCVGIDIGTCLPRAAPPRV
jgi:hypothetical protein